LQQRLSCGKHAERLSELRDLKATVDGCVDSHATQEFEGLEEVVPMASGPIVTLVRWQHSKRVDLQTFGRGDEAA
jgi:hypothetical protein